MEKKQIFQNIFENFNQKNNKNVLPMSYDHHLVHLR